MSKGANIYDRVRGQVGSILEARAADLTKLAAGKDPCIFLSHKNEDKDAVKAIGEYIKNAGINIYLDAEDADLQKAVRDRDDVKITAFIERGIQYSSDVMVLVSDKTQGSWCVPYEFGFGKNGGKYLASMRLKAVANPPSYLKIVRRLENITDLNTYLKEVQGRTPAVQVIKTAKRWDEYVLSLGGAYGGNTLMEAQAFSHPLASYLNK